MAHKILFVGLANSCRSQMAEGFARKYGLEAESAGTMPAHEISHGAVVAMREKGIDISGQKPKRINFRTMGRFERVIAMGQWVGVSSPDLTLTEAWGITNPCNLPLQVYRNVRDEIERKVKALADEIEAWSAPAR